MRRHSLSLLAVLTGSCLIGCHDDVVGPEEPAILSREIPSSELPTNLDPSRTYGWIGDGAPTQPEQILRRLWEHGFHPRRAWNPLPSGDLCPLWALYPTFTVELDAADARMLDQGFYQGTDGLNCTTRYMSYHVLN